MKTDRKLVLVLLGAAALHAQPPPGYVEPGLCANCHAAIAESYSRTPMARSFGSAASSEVPRGEFRHAPSEQTFAILERAGRPWLRRQQTGFDGRPANILERRIDYRVGSGHHARSYVSRNVSGDLIELPLTWYAEDGGHWSMSPAYDLPQHAGFSRKITYRCLSCHNGYPSLPAGAGRWENATRLPQQLPQGIDCQRCHGPGQAHVDSARAGAIVNPARLSPQRQMEVCLQCHLETTNSPLPSSLLRRGRDVFSYRPGEPLEEYALFFDHAPGAGREDKFEFAGAPYRLRKSACYLKSAGKLTCTTCHDPHRGPAGAKRNADVCAGCHPSAVSTHRQRQPHKPAADCVSCHMQRRRPSDALHVTVTDHYIQRVPPPPVFPAVEQNGSNTRYRGEVVLYYPDAPADPAAAELHTAAAQVVHQANLEPGMGRLERAIARWKPAEADFYADLAGALRITGQAARAADLYRQGIQRDAAHWPAHFGLGLTLAQSSAGRSLAIASLQTALSLAPWNTEIIKALAGTLGSVALLREATAADPDAADLHNNLGTALLRQGDTAGAERSLREAARLRPELASIRLNFATLLARTGQWPEARHEFEQALRLDDGSAEAHSAYGTALAARGELPAARTRLEAALARNPDLYNTRNNLGTLLERLGDSEGALREYRAALAARPAFSAAHYNLGVLLMTRREFTPAEQHLRTALGLGHLQARQKLAELCALHRCRTAVPPAPN